MSHKLWVIELWAHFDNQLFEWILISFWIRKKHLEFIIPKWSIWDRLEYELQLEIYYSLSSGLGGPFVRGGRGLIETLLHEWKFFENFSFDQKCEADRSWSGRYWTTSHFRQQNKSKAIKSNLRELQCAGNLQPGMTPNDLI